MRPSKPLFSVIIPHLNQSDQLDTCLTSLDEQTVERTLFEVIVVDNGSILLPEDVIGRHPGTYLLQEIKPGPGLARNRGVQAAIGDILLLHRCRLSSTSGLAPKCDPGTFCLAGRNHSGRRCTDLAR